MQSTATELKAQLQIHRAEWKLARLKIKAVKKQLVKLKQQERKGK